jgi:hypothetical protein
MSDFEDTFRPSPWSELLKRPRRAELIPRIIFSSGITTLTGKPGEGKSTLAVALLCTTAMGEVFVGQRVERRPVILVSGDGIDDLRPMYEAWQIYKDCTREPEGVFFEDGLDFFDGDHTGKMIAMLEGKPPPLIVTDALADVVGTADENYTKDMVKAFKNFWLLIKATKASLLIPHHSGHERQRERGSIVIRAKSDILIQVIEFDAKTGFMKVEHLKRRGGPKQIITLEVKLVAVPGYKELVPVVTGKELTEADLILGEKPAENEEHGRKLVRVMAEDKVFYAKGATSKQWQDASGMSDGTFQRGRKYAVETKKWVVGGGGKRQHYYLNPNSSWQEAIGANVSAFNPSIPFPSIPSNHRPLQGGGSVGSNVDPSSGSNWKQSGSDSNFSTTQAEEPPKTGTDPLSKASELVEKVGVKPPGRRKADAR